MRRWAVRICLFLLLGAIVNMAAAWGCAWRVQFDMVRPDRNGRDANGTRLITFVEFRDVGATRIVMDFWNNSTPVDNLPPFPPDSLPYWAAREADDTGKALDGYPIDSAGWPCRSMLCKWMNDWTLYDGIALGESQAAWVVAGRSALPTRIIWPGFAINMLFYAVILWMLFAVPFALRRWWRIKRGLCPACGYRVGVSDVCTECGAPHAVKPKAVPT